MPIGTTKDYMSYIENIVKKIDKLFDQYQDRDDLYMMVVKLIQDTAKESFKNGLETAKNRRSSSKNQKTSKVEK
jgi:hypothetical protein